jgi:hypothetical protein
MYTQFPLPLGERARLKIPPKAGVRGTKGRVIKEKSYVKPTRDF